MIILHPHRCISSKHDLNVPETSDYTEVLSKPSKGSVLATDQHINHTHQRREKGQLIRSQLTHCVSRHISTFWPSITGTFSAAALLPVYSSSHSSSLNKAWEQVRPLSVWLCFYTSVHRFYPCFGIYEASSFITHIYNPEQLQNLGNDKPNEFVFILNGGEMRSGRHSNRTFRLTELRNYHSERTEIRSKAQQNVLRPTWTQW